jgi:hypothetical protein
VPERDGSPGRLKFSHNRSGSRSNSNEQLLALSIANNHQQHLASQIIEENGYQTPRVIGDDQHTTEGQPPIATEPKSTIKLIPLRRGGSQNSEKKKSEDDDDDDMVKFQALSIQDSEKTSTIRYGKDDGSLAIPPSISHASYRPSTVAGFSRRNKDILNDDDMSVNSVNSTGQYRARKDNAMTSTSNSASPRPGDGKEVGRRSTVAVDGRGGQAKGESKDHHRNTSYVPSNGMDVTPPHMLPRGRSAANNNFSPTTGVRVRHL